MDQFQIYENFTNLYDEDEETRLQALLSKKDWILDRYYIPFTFKSEHGSEEYSSLECLLKQALPFSSMPIPRLSTKGDVTTINLFNAKYRVLKLHETLPCRPNKNTFYVEVNFKKLERSDYKELVKNFYFCLNKDYTTKLDFAPTDIRSILLPAMLGKEDEAVIIMENSILEKGAFKIDGMTKIYLYDDISEKEEAIIRRIAKFTSLKVVIVHE